MDRFIGNSDARADEKGRIFVPAGFRKILQSTGNTRLVLRKDIFQECLVLYPESVWNEELSLMRSRLNRWNEEQRQVYRKFVMDAEILTIDNNGRILLPKRYMEMAGIMTDVRFVGMDNMIEIWAKNKLEQSVLDGDAFKNGIAKWLSNE